MDFHSTLKFEFDIESVLSSGSVISKNNETLLRPKKNFTPTPIEVKVIPAK